MTDEMLEELRTIRTLLAIDKRDDIVEIVGELSDVQIHMVKILSHTEWMGISRSQVAEEVGVSEGTVSNHRAEMVDDNLIEKRGDGAGAEYRKTALLRVAELLNVVDGPED